MYICTVICGNSSVGRASASQAEGREFESRLPLFRKTKTNIKQEESLSLLKCEAFAINENITR